MDLSKLDLEAASEEPLECRVLHPVTKEPVTDSDDTECVIWIMGSESAEYKAASKRQRSRFAGKTSQEKVNDQEAIDQAIVHVLAEVTKSWQGLEWEGQPLPCNRENALMLYQKGGFKWLVRQLLATAGDHSRLPLGQPND